MGHFVSVRGWLAIQDEMEPIIKEIISLAPENITDNNVTSEDAKLYLQGWVFPEKYINWTKYIFYGADIRLRGLNFLRAHFRKIAQEVWLEDGIRTDYVSGLLDVEDEDQEICYLWKLGEGKLTEVNQNRRS